MVKRAGQHLTSSAMFVGHSFLVTAIPPFTGKAVVYMKWCIKLFYLIISVIL